MAGRFYVHQGMCEGYGRCVDAAPNNFTREHSYKARVRRQASNDDEKAQCIKAMGDCPLDAIFDNGGLRWTLSPGLDATPEGWQLQTFFPEQICRAHNWQEDSK